MAVLAISWSLTLLWDFHVAYNSTLLHLNIIAFASTPNFLL